MLSRLSGSGRTMLFASHRVEEIASLAKHVVVLERGAVTNSTDVSQFVTSLGVDATLHLTLKMADRAPAIELLQSSGFAPRLNGTGIELSVPREQKAAPLRVLAEARIAVEDFEVSANAPKEHLHDHVRSLQ